MASSQRLRGTVKRVPSGDSLVIMGGALERTITLSSLISPKLAGFRGQDEPFAWESREFLRKMCIGKEIEFWVDYKVAASNKEFGSVMMDEINLALEVVSAGWAQVLQGGRKNTNGVSPFIKELVLLEYQAKKKRLGKWNTDPAALKAAVRILPPSALGDKHHFDASNFLAANRKKRLRAIVEEVYNGSTVRVYLVAEFQYVQLLIAGIRSPTMRRQVAVSESQMCLTGNNSEPMDGTSTSDKYAREAKHFTEVRTLHRDVSIFLEGIDKFSNLIGSLHYPHGGSYVDLSLELLKNGLARVVEWSAKCLDEGYRRLLNNTELIAKKEKLRLWANYVFLASNLPAIPNDIFNGQVVEVVSGDCIIVLDAALPSENLSSERRVKLLSVQAPKMGRRGEDPAPYAREAREFLRSRLIGEMVSVLEYFWKGSKDVKTITFGSVFLQSASRAVAHDVTPVLPVAGQPNGINVAELLVAQGFASVVRNHDSQNRSSFYDVLRAAEARAKKEKKGMHSEKEPSSYHFTDLSGQGAAANQKGLVAKAKKFLASLVRYRRIPAIVEYVLSGHRYKLVIHKESCVLAFSLTSVRCPSRGEPYADHALRFMRHKIQQRDVEVEINNVDRTGMFFGTMWVSDVNVSVTLLTAGLAKLQPCFRPESTTEGHLLIQSQEKAKGSLMGVWEGYGEGQKVDVHLSGSQNPMQEIRQVKVTEVMGGGKFYANLANDHHVPMFQWPSNGERITPAPIHFKPKRGDLVLSQFSVDEFWYRARIVNAPWQSSSETGNENYEVFYIDYGNQEKTSFSKLRPLDSRFIFGAPGLALLFSLAHVRVPELEDDYGPEAAAYLSKMVEERIFMAKVVEKVSSSTVKSQGTATMETIILYEAEPAKSINISMLEAGLARVEKNRSYSKEKQIELEKFAEFQEMAKKQRLNIWCHGDIGSDEDNTTL